MKHRITNYLIEALLLGLFMVSACFFTALLEHPASPLHQTLPSALARRALIGLAMGLTAIFLIYSPMGKRSGAHMNPAVTLSFWRLGKMSGVDALSYMAFQVFGGLGGVWLSEWCGRSWVAHPAVNFAVTVPGMSGNAAAWMAEFSISFLLMGTVLAAMKRPAIASMTGLFAGVLVMLYITFEAPLSGMSMNPARSLASAIPAGTWTGFWIYLTAPPLAMLAAAELIGKGRRWMWCAKLVHDVRYPCLFCKTQGAAL